MSLISRVFSSFATLDWPPPSLLKSGRLTSISLSLSLSLFFLLTARGYFLAHYLLSLAHSMWKLPCCTTGMAPSFSASYATLTSWKPPRRRHANLYLSVSQSYISLAAWRILPCPISSFSHGWQVDASSLHHRRGTSLAY